MCQLWKIYQKEGIGFYVAFKSFGHIVTRQKGATGKIFPSLHEYLQIVFQSQRDHRQPSAMPHIYTGQLGYDRPLYDGFLHMTICLVPVRCISSIRHMYTTDFAYDRPIFLVPLSPSYPSSPVYRWGQTTWGSSRGSNLLGTHSFFPS